MKMFRVFCGALAAAVSALSVAAQPAAAQWSTTHEQFYLPGSFNWQFRKNYPSADRLFNAFDYGHAILYERLWSKPGAPVGLLENEEFDFVTKKLLVNPPNLPLEESAIETGYVKIAPEAKQMFDWAHLLHRQIYDVLADERLNPAQKDAKVAELLRYYKSRRDLAFSSQPKSMDLMEGQPYSLAFRKRYPKFNGLIWAYHWLQIGLYEPLLAGKDREERQTGVLAAVSRFRQMIEQPPTWMPRVMPMTPAVAPLFTARYPEAAIIFDNLHSMHDVISDVLANPSVGRDQKRAEILKAANRYRDNSSFLTTQEEWREMAAMMGVQNMGGPAVGFLAAFPTPTVERGAVMSHESMPGMNHSAPGSRADSAKSTGHSSMDHSAHHPPAAVAAAAPDHTAAMNALHARMLADPVIRARIQSDSSLRRLMRDAGLSVPEASRASSAKARASSAKAKKTTSKAKPTTSKAKPKPASKAKRAADPHAGMDHSKMDTQKKK
jgi:hypothetical protein